MMNKFAILFLTAAMTMGSGAAIAAASNNGSTNNAADAGAVSGGAIQKIAPNNVDNNKIKNSGDATTSRHHKKTIRHHKKLSANQIDQNSQCKDGKCPDINKKVGPGADTTTDGTTQ